MMITSEIIVLISGGRDVPSRSRDVTRHCGTSRRGYGEYCIQLFGKGHGIGPPLNSVFHGVTDAAAMSLQWRIRYYDRV